MIKLGEQIPLKNLQIKYQKLFDHAMDAIFVADAGTGIILDCNRAASKLVGRKKSELIGKSQRLIHPPSQSKNHQFSSTFRQHLADREGQVLETQVITKNQQIKDVAIKANLFQLEQRQVIQGIFHDITKEKKLEKRQQDLIKTFRLQRDMLETIMENTTAHLAYLDNDFNFIKVNSTYAKGSGYSADQLVGKNHFDLFPNKENQTFFRKAVKTGQPIDFKAKPFIFEGDPDRGTTYWDWRLSPIKNRQGEVNRLVLSLVDVTNLKNLEKSKDKFLGVASHELKTPLTSLKVYAQILAKTCHCHERSRPIKYLKRMNYQIDRMTHLINELLGYSMLNTEPVRLRLKRFSLLNLIQETAESLEQMFGTHQIIVKGNQKQPISADKERIIQVLINLLTNAIKFSPKASRVVVTATARQKEVVVSIRDFGIGISPSEQQKIFAPFYSSEDKEASRFTGLGIGLYISSEIIKRHHGRLWVKSQKGKGANFYFSLPYQQTSQSRIT